MRKNLHSSILGEFLKSSMQEIAKTNKASLISANLKILNPKGQLQDPQTTIHSAQINLILKKFPPVRRLMCKTVIKNAVKNQIP